MIRQNYRYLTLESLLINMIEKEITIVNPFTGFNVFKITDTDYDIDADALFKLFKQRYKQRLVGQSIPCKGRKVINDVLPNAIKIIETESDQIEYVWNFFYYQLTGFLAENKDNYTRLMAALTAEYNPIENYNMVEFSGSASKVSDTKSNPGTVTAKNNVFPFDSNSGTGKPESLTETSATQSTAGFVDASQSMQWAAGDDFGSTPAGNSVAMSKHTRTGNIGVTTSQQMLQQEIELRAKSIVDDFLKRAADTCLLAMWD